MKQSTAVTTLAALTLPLSLCLSVVGLGRQQDGSPPAGPVTATEFRLVRPDGSVCGVWSATAKTSTLSLGDASGMQRLKLFTSDKGFVGAAMLDGEGKLRSTWGCTAAGETGFMTYGADRVPRIEINSSDKDAASVVIRDAKGSRRNFLGILDSGASAFTLFSPENRVVAALTTPVTGEGFNPSMVLYDSKLGTMRAAVSVGEDGEPAVSLHGKKEEMRSLWSLAGNGGALAWFDQRFRMQSVFGTAPDGTAGMMVFDPAGKMMFRAPENFDQVPGRNGGGGGNGRGRRR